MARLSEDKINQILQSVDIVDVIGDDLSLERRGRNYWAVCPFHDDTNPSMSISTDKQIYKCFVCGAGGNSFTYLQNRLGISYLEAVKKVAEMGRIDVSELQQIGTIEKIDPALAPMYKMHEEALEVYQHYLHTQSGHEALTYLKTRNLDDDVIKRFSIGYAPLGDVVSKSFAKLEFNEIDIQKSGLVVEGNQKNYDRFKDRIVFPLWDLDGKIVGFSGRIYHDGQVDEAKYVNSPETNIFIKGNTLYNFHLAKNAMKKEKFVYLLEGFMDVIALYRAGIENAIAIMGTALTTNQMKAIHKVVNEVVICLDGDKPGKLATLKAYQELIKFGFKVKIVKMTAGKDPDEILQESGKDALNHALNKKVSGIEFMIDYYYETSNMENFQERYDYVNKITQEIAKLNNSLEMDHYIELLTQKSKFEKSSIQKLLQETQSKYKPISRPIQPIIYKETSILKKYYRAEVELLFYMLLDKQVALRYEKELGVMYQKELRIIASHLIDYYRKHETCELNLFIHSLGDQKLIDIMIAISSLKLQVPYEPQALDDYIKSIQSQAIKMEIKQLLKKLENENDVVKKAQIAMEIQQLKSKM